MPVYNYVGLNKKGEVVKGKVEAENPKAARQNIKELGYMPTKVTAETSAQEKMQSQTKHALQSLTLKEKLDFTSTFLTLNRAGVPIIESLIFMEQDAGSRRIRLLGRELRRQIIAGSTFSDTVARYPEIFGAVYIGLIKAGEESGELDVTLERIAGLLKKQDDLNQKILEEINKAKDYISYKNSDVAEPIVTMKVKNLKSADIKVGLTVIDSTGKWLTDFGAETQQTVASSDGWKELTWNLYNIKADAIIFQDFSDFSP